MNRALFSAGVCCIFLINACSPSPESLRQKMEELAETDLKDILTELNAKDCDSLISPNPYYEIEEFQVFTGDTARVFGAYAKINFYYLKSLKLYQIRKYRYKTEVGVWDRYDIKLKFLFSKENQQKQAESQ